MPITALTLIRPSPSITGQHQLEDLLHGRIADVEREPQPAVEPAQPGQRQQELDQRADDDRAGVDVELAALGVGARHADDEPDDDRQVPERPASAPGS